MSDDASLSLCRTQASAWGREYSCAASRSQDLGGWGGMASATQNPRVYLQPFQVVNHSNRITYCELSNGEKPPVYPIIKKNR